MKIGILYSNERGGAEQEGGTLSGIASQQESRALGQFNTNVTASSQLASILKSNKLPSNQANNSCCLIEYVEPGQSTIYAVLSIMVWTGLI